MTKTVKGAVITNRLYVPAEHIDRAKLEKHYLPRFYKEAGCAKCPFLQERHCTECETCPNFTGEIKLWREKEVDGKDYIAIPPGNISRLEAIMNIELKDIDDRRKIVKLKHPIKFIGKLFTGKTIGTRKTVNQVDLVDKWMKTKTGVIVSPARSGKTVTAVNIVCRLGVKTLITAHQEEFLLQFLATFIGDKSQNRVAMTNARKVGKRVGKPIVGIVRKIEDFKKYDICLFNYQKLIRKETANERIRKYIKGRFSLVIVDEGHHGSATAFAKFLSKLDCKYRLMLSATPMRKDGKDIIATQILGPEVARAAQTGLMPDIKIVETGVSTKYQHKLWVYAMKFLASHKARNKLIIDMIFKDYKAGHKAIIIPVDFKAHAIELQRQINERAREEDYEGKFAEIFHAGCNRKKILTDIDKGKIPVLIAIRSMIKEGIDVSLPSCMYIVVPMSAVAGIGAPMFYQLSNRICTWKEGKIQPEIKIFVDGIGASVGCFRGLFLKEIWPKLVAQKDQQACYRIDEIEKTRAWQIIKNRNYHPINKPGELMSSKQILKKLNVNLDIGKSGKIKTASNRRF